MLHTLGGLRHLGEVRQPKLLLLLSYLALEGSTPRRSLAQLFWPASPRPLSNLSVALSTIRGSLPDAVEARPDNVRAHLRTDVHALLDALEADDEARAAELYRGPFLLGAETSSMGAELEEWVLARRESIAERYRHALLRWAEASRDLQARGVEAGPGGPAVAGHRGPTGPSADDRASSPVPTDPAAAAARLADAAYRVAGAPPADADTLRWLFRLLAPAGHPTATEVLEEAAELGIELGQAPEHAGPSAPEGDAGRVDEGPRPGAAVTQPGRGDAEPHPGAAVTQPAPVQEEPRPAPPPSARGLIGREPERLEVHRLLAGGEARLVTLHGPGGIGKTSLAIQVANDLLDADDPPFPGGVAFVELEGVHDASALPFAIARALGRTSLHGQRGIEALRAVLPAERTLLVLDNLEQVEGAPNALERLLSSAPALSVLATSRELLCLREEVAFPLDGLRVPESADTEGAAAYDAVRLFRQVARRADATFELEPPLLPDVVRVCRAVGGSPLGIELAAAWVRAVPVDVLANEVEADASLLRRASASGPDRHASARASFDRSWDRLDAPHRRALASLSAFSGGFTLADAREVTRVSLAQVARLVDAALLRLGNGGRYEQHPLVARFARERLARSPARERDVLDRHAERFLSRLASRTHALRALSVGVLDGIDAEFDDLRSAWLHAVATRRADLVAGAAFPLMRYADLRARLHEGKALFAAAATAAWPAGRDGDRARGRALASLAWTRARLGDHGAAVEAAARASSLLDTLDDADGVRVARHALAISHYLAGDYGSARSAYEDLLARLADDPVYRGEVLGRLGLVAQAVGEYDHARERYLEALADYRAVGNVSGVVTQLVNLGALEMNTDAQQAAAERFEEALGLAREHGYHQVIPVLLHNLANLACKARRFAEAREMAQEALRRVVASGERGLESGMLATLGWIELEAGDLAAAEAHARRAVSVAADVGDEPAQQTARVRLGQVLLARGREGEAAALLDAAAEHPATLTWARRLARRLRQEVAG
ncbi:MAG TPA: tetratricopeptide repeat protein [Trueperaceae bacterium]